MKKTYKIKSLPQTKKSNLIKVNFKKGGSIPKFQTAGEYKTYEQRLAEYDLEKAKYEKELQLYNQKKADFKSEGYLPEGRGSSLRTSICVQNDMGNCIDYNIFEKKLKKIPLRYQKYYITKENDEGKYFYKNNSRWDDSWELPTQFIKLRDSVWADPKNYVIQDPATGEFTYTFKDKDFEKYFNTLSDDFKTASYWGIPFYQTKFEEESPKLISPPVKTQLDRDWEATQPQELRKQVTKSYYEQLPDGTYVKRTYTDVGKTDTFEFQKGGIKVNFKKGGSIPKYQTAGQKRLTPEELIGNQQEDVWGKMRKEFDQVDTEKRINERINETNKDVIDYYNQYMRSPRYKEMLGPNPDIAKQREYNLGFYPGQMPEVNVAKDQSSGESSWGAYSMPNTGDITILPLGYDLKGVLAHEWSHSMDRPAEGSTERAIPQKDIDYINKVTPPDSRILELPRLSNFKGFTFNQLREYYPEVLESETNWKNELAKPTEVRARLNDIRYQAKQRNLYDPFTQKVTPDIYQKLLNTKFETGDKERFDALKQLKGIYTDEQIIYMLNNISQKENSKNKEFDFTQNEEFNFAQKGGKIPKYQTGRQKYNIQKPKPIGYYQNTLDPEVSESTAVKNIFRPTEEQITKDREHIKRVGDLTKAIKEETGVSHNQAVQNAQMIIENEMKGQPSMQAMPTRLQGKAQEEFSKKVMDDSWTLSDYMALPLDLLSTFSPPSDETRYQRRFRRYNPNTSALDKLKESTSEALSLAPSAALNVGLTLAGMPGARASTIAAESMLPFSTSLQKAIPKFSKQIFKNPLRRATSSKSNPLNLMDDGTIVSNIDKVKKLQKTEFDKGIEFGEKWVLGNNKKELAIDPEFKRKVQEIYDRTNSNMPKEIGEDVLNMSKKSELVYLDPRSSSFKELHPYHQYYLLDNYDRIGGVRMGERVLFGPKNKIIEEIPSKTITLASSPTLKRPQFNYFNPLTWDKGNRFLGLLRRFNRHEGGYTYFDPSRVSQTAIHETGHDIQSLYDRWLKQIGDKYNEEMAYSTGHEENLLAKAFKDAMVEGVKVPKGSRYDFKTWLSSQGELHSELMAGRLRKAEQLMANENKTMDEAIQIIKKLEREGNDDLFNFYLKGEGNFRGLDKHFKETTDYTTKKTLVQILPQVALALGVGTAAASQYKQGGSTPKFNFKKGYRRVYEEDSGSTEFGKKKVIDVYRPMFGTSKTIEKDITYASDDEPRKKFTEREVTKTFNDGSLKSYKMIRRKDGKLLKEYSTPKQTFEKGEMPHNLIQKIGYPKMF